MAFPGFRAADFAVYAPAKWRSNVYNRDRLEVKERLLALARDAGAHLTAADGAPLTIEASVEHPALSNHKQVEAQHVFFSRNEEARRELDRINDRERGMKAILDDPTPQRTHVFLCLTVTEPGFDVALKLHPDAKVDRDNLTRKCADRYERMRLRDLLIGMGADFTLGVGTGGATQARAITDDALGAILSGFASGQGPLCVQARVPSELAVASGEGLTEFAQSALEDLLPVYHFAAWTRDNDFVSMREILQKEKQAKLQRGLSRNDRVRIIRGVLSGKQGVVQEIDARGALKVLVGKLAVKVDAEDVVKQ
jgi:hypothetical protein